MHLACARKDLSLADRAAQIVYGVSSGESKEAVHAPVARSAPVDQEASASGIMEAAKVTTRLYQKQVASKIRGLQNELTATKRQLKRTQSALYQVRVPS